MSAAGTNQLTVVNNCTETIWPAIYDNFDQKINFGWEAESKSSNSVEIPDGWAGIIWGRQGCDGNGTSCKTGDCGGSDVVCSNVGTGVTYGYTTYKRVAEMGDWYSISLETGFNLPIEITPVGGALNCSRVSCAKDFTQDCVGDDVWTKDDNGDVLACGVTDTEKTSYRAECPQTIINYVTDIDDSGMTFNCSTAESLTLTFCPSGESTGDLSSSQSSFQSPDSSTSSPSSTSSSAASPTADSETNESKGPKPPAIAWIVVAIVLAIAAGILGFILCRRRRRRKQLLEQQSPPNVQPFMVGEFTSEPFLAEKVAASGSSANGTVSPYPMVFNSSSASGEPEIRQVLDGKHVLSPNLDTPTPVTPTPVRRKLDPNVQSPTNRAASDSPAPSREDLNIASGTMSPGTSAADPPDHLAAGSPVAPGMQTTPVDIQRLFEDRRFEDQLLSFISQRMDPPPAHPFAETRRMDDIDESESVAPPPTYREP